MISLNNVHKNYYVGKETIHALKNINLRINKGDFLSVVGPSGSGKTTLLNLIGLLDKPTIGEIYLDNINIAKCDNNKLADLRAEKIGFVFQNFNLIPVLNVYDNIELSLILSNKKDLINQRKNLINKVIEEVGLEGYLKHRPFELSGGQKQRVAIARALIKKPDIILADEPTANLDTQTAISIINIMKYLNENENISFLFSTHDERLIKYTKSQIRIKDGKIEE